MVVSGNLNDNHQSGTMPAALAFRSNSYVMRKPTARIEAEKSVMLSDMRAHIVGVIAIHNRRFFNIFLLKHSKPKIQPPKNDRIKAAYNIDVFSKNVFKLGFITDNLKVDRTPNKNGTMPKMEISFTAVGILLIRLYHVKFLVL